MRKYLYVLAAFALTPTLVFAQSLESDVDAELDQMYSDANAAAPAAPSAAIGSSGSVSGQPIYILNQATPTSTAQVQQAQVQKQPTTIIEASPLTDSRAEQMRRARQDSEMQTEQRIVEKLEQSRMEDEKRRADQLFGDRFNNRAPVEQVQPQQQQIIVAPPVQVQQVQEPKENTRDIVREEITAAMRAEEESRPSVLESKYVAGILGVGDYPDTQNVQGNYAMGVAFGSKHDNFIIEGSFLFSNYTVNNNSSYAQPAGMYPMNRPYLPSSVDLKQYQGSLAAKVQLFDGIIKPVFGGLVGYSYRNYSWNQDNSMCYGCMSYVNDTTAKSHAIDIGTIVGADLEFHPKYSVGVDFRYMWNLSSRVDTGNTWLDGQYGMISNRIEKLQYYVMSISGKVNF